MNNGNLPRADEFNRHNVPQNYLSNRAFDAMEQEPIQEVRWQLK